MKHLEPGWLGPFLGSSDGFPRPLWLEVDEHLREHVPEADWQTAYDSAAREWCVAMCSALGPGYETSESQNFLFVTPFERKVFEARHAFAERARKRILEELLPGIAGTSGFGKHVVFVFDDHDRYYTYLAPFYPEEGQFAASAGCFVGFASDRHPHGYGHFVMFRAEPRQNDTTLAHELTHNLLAPLPLPHWLDEGIATSLDAQLAHGPPFGVRREDLDEHRATWSDGGIQEFWSGAAWFHPDDRNRLAYHLAQLAVRALAKDYGRFREFARLADHADAGETAAIQVYGRGLGGLIEQILGPGDWDPDPASWDVE